MENVNQKSWFGRNWPWVLPVGCCSGCLIAMIVFILGSGVALFKVFEKVVDVSPIEEVVTKAENNPKVKEILGNPIETTGFPSGSISLQNGDGDVDFSIEIKGSKGEGTLYVKGIRANEKWIFEDLYITLKETGEQINLLENEKVLEAI